MSNIAEFDAEVDCIGVYCPMPLSMTKEKIDDINIGQILKITADDPAAEEDFKRWAKRTGHKIIKIEKEEQIITIYIKKMR